MQPAVNLPVSGIKSIIAGHLEILFRDMLDKQFNKLNGWEGLSDESIILMPVIMESHVVPVIRINSGKGDDGAPEVAADIFDNGCWVAEVWLCVNIEAVFVSAIYIGFRLFKRRTKAFFKLV